MLLQVCGRLLHVCRSLPRNVLTICKLAECSCKSAEGFWTSAEGFPEMFWPFTSLQKALASLRKASSYLLCIMCCKFGEIRGWKSYILFREAIFLFVIIYFCPMLCGEILFLCKFYIFKSLKSKLTVIYSITMIVLICEMKKLNRLPMIRSSIIYVLAQWPASVIRKALWYLSKNNFPESREYSECTHVIGQVMLQQVAARLKNIGTYEKNIFNSQCNIYYSRIAGIFTSILCREASRGQCEALHRYPTSLVPFIRGTQSRRYSHRFLYWH